jgi:predicted ABC-class ATPase
VQVSLPNRGTSIRGMGVQKGVTLVCGGGFHGKSTLLEALETGIYPKIPGDGRELVVTDPAAVKIRAEDGRRVEAVDVSPFIRNLPFGRDTTAFTTQDASGSTSQAANIQEALELGATALLVDEDTSATNFMIRDARMAELIAADKEPITPFVSKVRALAARGVSCVVVAGGSGEYFGVADRVLAMDCYTPRDVTEQAHAIAARHDALALPGWAADGGGGSGYGTLAPRALEAIHPGQGDRGNDGRGGGSPRVKARAAHLIQVDDEEIDLR